MDEILTIFEAYPPTQVKYFLLALPKTASSNQYWKIISLRTIDYEEAMSWYNIAVNDEKYLMVNIGQTIFG